MEGNELTDLVTRAGKAGGGYCTKLATYGVPFVFTTSTEPRATSPC